MNNRKLTVEIVDHGNHITVEYWYDGTSRMVHVFKYEYDVTDRIGPNVYQLIRHIAAMDLQDRKYFPPNFRLQKNEWQNVEIVIDGDLYIDAAFLTTVPGIQSVTIS